MPIIQKSENNVEQYKEIEISNIINVLLNKYNFKNIGDLINFIENNLNDNYLIKENKELKKENKLLKNIIGNILNKQTNNIFKTNVNYDIKNKNIELPFPKCPVVSINNKDDLNIDWKKHVSTEILNIVENNYILYEKINKDEELDKKSLEEVVTYIIKKRDIKFNKSNKKYIRDSIIRSSKLYKDYKSDLKYINFSFYEMTRLNNNEWLLFLEYIRKKINEAKRN